MCAAIRGSVLEERRVVGEGREERRLFISERQHGVLKRKSAKRGTPAECPERKVVVVG
jgi:hypothetical protein